MQTNKKSFNIIYIKPIVIFCTMSGYGRYDVPSQLQKLIYDIGIAFGIEKAYYNI